MVYNILMFPFSLDGDKKYQSLFVFKVAVWYFLLFVNPQFVSKSFNNGSLEWNYKSKPSSSFTIENKYKKWLSWHLKVSIKHQHKNITTIKYKILSFNKQW